jgi:hypothetical protein
VVVAFFLCWAPFHAQRLGYVYFKHSLVNISAESTQRSNPKKKAWCIGPYAGVDYNLTLCPLQSRLQPLQHIYYGQPICQSRP